MKVFGRLLTGRNGGVEFGGFYGEQGGCVCIQSLDYNDGR